jgi:thymidylate synthase ThyX
LLIYNTDKLKEASMLTVKLAGYNADADIIAKTKKEGWDGLNNISPETISAAYARISRDPRPVTELRADSLIEVDRARKSNENIVFKMGHHSVAEHAYLNFDILGLSRLAVESLEEARLCSYTEKSQRYITLEGDYVKPFEFGSAAMDIFDAAIARQVGAYKKLFPVLFEYRKKQYPEQLKTKSGFNLLEGWAKEDARYVLALGTECQLGFSTNARNLEHIIRKLKYHPLSEVRQLSAELYDRAKDIVPSLVILSDPEAFKKQFGAEVSDGILKNGREKAVKSTSKVLKAMKPGKAGAGKSSAVLLAGSTPDADSRIVAAVLAGNSNKTYGECLATAKKLGTAGRVKFVKSLFAGLNEHDSLYREFEAVNFVYDIVLSSSAFAQMKRHRMMSIFKQPYDVSLGFTTPPSIIETKQLDVFNEVMDETYRAHKKLLKSGTAAAEYILTNAHRRRIIVNANLRELYHIARLRMDWHAQWDIQDISAQMVKVTQKAAPLTAALACGKDKFKEVYLKFMKK